MSDEQRARGRAPDFYIAGHQKCGTSAMYHMLRQHPQVFMPRVKEPRFFAPDLHPPVPAGQPDTRKPRHRHELDAYLELFADARPGQLVGEASPDYLRSERAAELIAAQRPDAKIVAIFREPVSFLRSLHLQALHNDTEDEADFQTAIELEERRRRGERMPRKGRAPKTLMYTDHVRYAEQLARFRDAFGVERVLALVYEDYRRDNVSVLRQVLRFLGVEEDVVIVPVDTDRLVPVRNQRVRATVQALRRARRRPQDASAPARVAAALLPERLVSDERVGSLWKRLAYAERPREPDVRFLAALRERFRGEVAALGEQLGRDLLSEWGYEMR